MLMAILVAAISVFLFTVHQDISTRHIPNEATLAIALLGAIRIIASDHAGAAMLTFVAAAVVLAAALLLWWKGIVGGGDVKLVAATALLIGHQNIIRFLFLMSVCGAVLAISALLGRKRGLALRGILPVAKSTAGKSSEQSETLLHRSSVPYGAAIAVAGSIVLMLHT